MSRAYDAANRVATHTFADGNVMEWTYDDRDVVMEVQYDGESVLNQIHDPGYRCTNQTFGNGLDRTITFGRQDNLRTNDKVEDTGVINELNFDYTYAADKNILSETSPNGALADLSFNATYDPGNRVATWNRADHYPGARESQTWNYDNAGNWNSTTIDGNTQDRTNNTSDEATEIDGNNLSYDSRGNLLQDEDNQDYTWDIDNRIAEIDPNNGSNNIEYGYDAFSRRVYKRQGGDEEVLLWWGKEEYAEHESIGSQPVIQNDLHADPNGLNTTFGRALEGDKNDIQYFHKNYLDHVYAVSDDNGNIIEQYRYSAFGEVELFDGTGSSIAASTIGNDILWNVKRLDADSGLYMYLYRHYDPAHGRWLSRDPIEEEFGQQDLYKIIGNSPLSDYDIFGMIPGLNVFYFEVKCSSTVTCQCGESNDVCHTETVSETGSDVDPRKAKRIATARTATTASLVDCTKGNDVCYCDTSENPCKRKTWTAPKCDPAARFKGGKRFRRNPNTGKWELNPQRKDTPNQGDPSRIGPPSPPAPR